MKPLGECAEFGLAPCSTPSRETFAGSMSLQGPKIPCAPRLGSREMSSEARALMLLRPGKHMCSHSRVSPTLHRFNQTLANFWQKPWREGHLHGDFPGSQASWPTRPASFQVHNQRTDPLALAADPLGVLGRAMRLASNGCNTRFPSCWTFVYLLDLDHFGGQHKVRTFFGGPCTREVS